MLDPVTAAHIAAVRGQFYAGLAKIKREAGLCSETEYRSALEERDETYCAARAAGIAREAFVIIPNAPRASRSCQLQTACTASSETEGSTSGRVRQAQALRGVAPV